MTSTVDEPERPLRLAGGHRAGGGRLGRLADGRLGLGRRARATAAAMLTGVDAGALARRRRGWPAPVGTRAKPSRSAQPEPSRRASTARWPATGVRSFPIRRQPDRGRHRRPARRAAGAAGAPGPGRDRGRDRHPAATGSPTRPGWAAGSHARRRRARSRRRPPVAIDREVMHLGMPSTSPGGRRWCGGRPVAGGHRPRRPFDHLSDFTALGSTRPRRRSRGQERPPGSADPGAGRRRHDGPVAGRGGPGCPADAAAAEDAAAVPVRSRLRLARAGRRSARRGGG